MVNRPFIGLLLGLIVEGRHWVKIRWDFGNHACERAWQLSLAGVLLTAALLWLDGDRHETMHNTLSWLPALLMPLQFVQSFGFRESMPASVFSIMAKRRDARNLKLGLLVENTTFNFGYAMVAATLLASSVGTRSSGWMFLPGLVILSGWLLMWLGRCRLALLMPVLLMTGLLALGGRLGMEYLYNRFGHGGGDRSSRFDPNFVDTLIGTPGSVKQSPNILWRVNLPDGNPSPKLLHTATYNNFLGTSWRNRRDVNDDFLDLDTVNVGEKSYRIFQDASRFGSPESYASFTLRGSAIAESPLPMPGDAVGLTGFELDGVDRNSSGTTRVFPKHPVIDGTVLWRGQGNTESPPRNHDLHIPNAEKRKLAEMLNGLGISQNMPLREQAGVLQRFFHHEFRYTRTPAIRQSFYLPGKPTAISRFLTDERAGHCEYFATAAVLMLRQNGIPARYATGYALLEHADARGSYVIRGTHGHAWCRLWDAAAGKWRDFDPTPPDWTASLNPSQSRLQRFNDWLQEVREDFYLWRNRPENRKMATSVIVGIAILTALYMTRRLWSSRQRIETTPSAIGFSGPLPRTPLHALEKPVRRILGERPPGQPFAAWLMQLSMMPSIAAKLAEAITLHQKLRFDPAEAPAEDQIRLAELTSELDHAISALSVSKAGLQTEHLPAGMP